MAIVHRTAVVWLPVTDMPRALSFYRDTLSLDAVRGGDDWSELDANGLHIGLNATESPAGPGGAVIAFEPQGGLDATIEQLRSDGVAIAGESASTLGDALPPSKIPTTTISNSTSRPSRAARRVATASQVPPAPSRTPLGGTSESTTVSSYASPAERPARPSTGRRPSLPRRAVVGRAQLGSEDDHDPLGNVAATLAVNPWGLGSLQGLPTFRAHQPATPGI